MQKMNTITEIVFERLKLKKSCNLIGGEHFAHKLRKRFSPGMQFSQNHIANHGASFKAQKVMLPHSTFCPNFSCLPNYLENRYIFPKSGFVFF